MIDSAPPYFLKEYKTKLRVPLHSLRRQSYQPSQPISTFQRFHQAKPQLHKMRIIFLLAVVLLLQSCLSAQINTPTSLARHVPATVRQLEPKPCPCRCYTGNGKRRKSAMICGRGRFVLAGCVISRCLGKGDIRGFQCCDEPPTTSAPPSCPCKCFPGIPGRRRSRRQCEVFEGCEVSRCSRRKKRRYQCCDPVEEKSFFGR